MGTAGIVIMTLFTLLLLALASGAALINYEQRKHLEELRDLEKEAERNAKKSAEIMQKASEKISAAHTGDHRADMRTMADQLHDLSQPKQ